MCDFVSATHNPTYKRKMTFKLDPANDPNVAYEVRPADVPPGWFEVRCNGVGVRYFSDRAKAERFATDPEYRQVLLSGKKAWER